MARLTDGSDLEEGMDLEDDRRNAQGSRFNTAGNDADVEDNVQPMYIPTPEELFQKLRFKPAECCPTNPCRMLSAREDSLRNGPSRMPSTAERLTCRPKSALETITGTISRPEGAVPPLALPDWHCLPLEQKIPRIPAPPGLLYYTPGKVSIKLHRKPKVYSTQDPYNRERVVGSSYTALHDPHAKDFIKRPQTRKILYSQGLINENDEIMYSLKEFNKFRDYLKTLYTDEIHANIHGADDLWRTEQEQLKVIRKYISSTEGREASRMKRLKKARWLEKESREFNRTRFLRKREEIEARTNAWIQTRALINTEKVVRSLEKSRLQKQRLRKLAEERQQHIVASWHHSIAKEIEALERRNQDRLIMKQAQENFLLEWMDAKINFSKVRVDKTANINVAWHESLKSKARKRQRRMEVHRENIPKIIEKKKEYEAYRWRLAKKYFYIWLEKVRAKMHAPQRDDQHESVFIKGVSGTLEYTVEYLRFQAGNEERLDTFILNILRLKEEIKKQLALEDDEGLEDHEDLIDREVTRRLTLHYGAEELKSLQEARSQSRKSMSMSSSVPSKSKKSITAVTQEERRKSVANLAAMQSARQSVSHTDTAGAGPPESEERRSDQKTVVLNVEERTSDSEPQ